MEILKTCPFEEPIGEYEIENDKPMMTNEEWFNGLSTEEKAGFISAVLDYGFGIDYKPINPMGENVHTKEDIERWLKEEHNG